MLSLRQPRSIMGGRPAAAGVMVTAVASDSLSFFGSAAAPASVWYGVARTFMLNVRLKIAGNPGSVARGAMGPVRIWAIVGCRLGKRALVQREIG